jgi:hypothetical protein
LNTDTEFDRPALDWLRPVDVLAGYHHPVLAMHASQVTLQLGDKSFRPLGNSLPCAWLAALPEYRRDWDEKLKVFKDSPRHDWASHAADAFTYLAMGWKQKTKPEPEAPRPLYKSLQ